MEMQKEQSRPVSFATYVSQPQATRADSALMAVNEIPVGKSIGVYAYYHDDSTWAEDDATAPKNTVPNFMCNQKVTNDGNGQAFTYSPIKYWPNEETDKVSFIAYYPYSHSGEEQTATGVSSFLHNLGNAVPYGSGLPVFRFSVKDDVKRQVDFMISDLIPDLPQSRATDPNPGNEFNNLTITDRVRFNFKHALSKVEFRIVVDEAVRKSLAYFTLNSITITNIYNEALLTTSYTPATPPDIDEATTLTWSDYRNSHKTDYDCKTTEAYLLMPQTLRNDARLTVTYDLTFKSDGTTYTYDGSGNPVATEEYSYGNRTTTVQLNTLKLSGTSTPITAWEPNHHYVYYLVIRPLRIDFTAQVVYWGQSIYQDLILE